MHGFSQCATVTPGLASANSSDPETAALGQKLRQWEASWVEQRLYPGYAVDALDGAAGEEASAAARGK